MNATFTGTLYVLCSCCKGSDIELNLDKVELSEIEYELREHGWKNGECPTCRQNKTMDYFIDQMHERPT